MYQGILLDGSNPGITLQFGDAILRYIKGNDGCGGGIRGASNLWYGLSILIVLLEPRFRYELSLWWRWWWWRRRWWRRWRLSPVRYFYPPRTRFIGTTTSTTAATGTGVDGDLPLIRWCILNGHHDTYHAVGIFFFFVFFLFALIRFTVVILVMKSPTFGWRRFLLLFVDLWDFLLCRSHGGGGGIVGECQYGSDTDDNAEEYHCHCHNDEPCIPIIHHGFYR